MTPDQLEEQKAHRRLVAQHANARLSDDYADENVNHWLRASSELGIDDSVYDRKLEVPAWAKQEAGLSGLRTMLNTGETDRARADEAAARQAQFEAINQLGQTSGIAGLQQQQAQEGLQRQIAARMAAQGGAAAGQRGAIMAQSQAGAQLGNQAVAGAANEALQAQAARADALAGMQKTDQQHMSAEGQQMLGAGAHKLQQGRLGLAQYGQGISAEQDNIRRAIDKEQLAQEMGLRAKGVDVAEYKSQMDMAGRATAGALQAAGSITGAAIKSDVRAKTAIAPADDMIPQELRQMQRDGVGRKLMGKHLESNTLPIELQQLRDSKPGQQLMDSGEDDETVREFLGKLRPYQYDYKDPQRHEDGRHLGVMAQDLERSQVGSRFVDEAPDGTKMVDASPEKTWPVTLASLADMNRRMERLEEEQG